MTTEPMSPAERAYMREVFGTSAGIKFLSQLMAMKPRLVAQGTLEETAMAAKALSGYEQAIGNMSTLLYESPKAPELKSVDVRTD